jgi:hypothetical protein
MLLAAKNVKSALIKKGWFLTKDNSILVKNNCFLHLSIDVSPMIETDSFSYNKEDIEALKDNNYCTNELKLSPAIRLLPSNITLRNEQFYLEKFGWLLLKGKYPSACNEIKEDELTSDFYNFIDNIDNIAQKDSVAIKSIKQHLVTRKKPKTVFQAIATNKAIAEESLIEVQKDSIRCDIFKASAIFKVVLIADSGVIVTAVNKKGALTNKNFQIDPDVFLNEALEKNIIAVEYLPSTVEEEYQDWEVFSSKDFDTKLPDKVSSLISNKTQEVYIRELFNSCYNYSALLNDNIAEDAIPLVADLLKENYVTPEIFYGRIRESNIRLIKEHFHLGLDPKRFFDDSLDSYTLETELQYNLQKCENYKNSLSSNISDNVKDIAYKYLFKYGEELSDTLDDTTRWQFLIPWFYKENFSKEQIMTFVSLIKAYGTLHDDGASIKIGYFDALSKGSIINYYKVPNYLEYNGKSWNDFLLELLSNDVKINFTINNLEVIGASYRLRRDYNSVAIYYYGNQPVWRCVFINEENFISSDTSHDVMFY